MASTQAAWSAVEGICSCRRCRSCGSQAHHDGLPQLRVRARGLQGGKTSASRSASTSREAQACLAAAAVEKKSHRANACRDRSWGSLLLLLRAIVLQGAGQPGSEESTQQQPRSAHKALGRRPRISTGAYQLQLRHHRADGLQRRVIVQQRGPPVPLLPKGARHVLLQFCCKARKLKGTKVAEREVSRAEGLPPPPRRACRVHEVCAPRRSPPVDAAFWLHGPQLVVQNVHSDEALEPPGHVEPLLVLGLRLVQRVAAAQDAQGRGCRMGLLQRAYIDSCPSVQLNS